MATATQRKIERLQDKVNDLSNAISDLEYEIGELNVGDISLDQQMTADIGSGEWTFTKRDAVLAFDLLEQIGLDESKRYSMIQIEEIRLAVERILR